MSRRRVERELLEQVRDALRTAGIREWDVSRTGRNHLMVTFIYQEQPRRLIIHGSGNWRMRQYVKMDLRRLMKQEASI